MINKKNFKKIYSDSWKYLKKSKNFIWVIILLFVLFAFIGFSFPVSGVILEKISEFVKQLIEQTENLNFIELFGFIFWNNLKVSFFGMIFGVLLGIVPIIIIVANGYLLGIISSLVVKEEGFLSLWRLVPHGIFELPAVFISIALGLKLGMFIFQKEKIKSLKSYLRNSLKVFLTMVLPLLIIAALIESFFISFLG